MLYRIFTLYPQIFDSFFGTSLIARGVDKNVINYELVNWREEYGVGNHKQVDDKQYGGGSGMVLQCEPIYSALMHYNAVTSLEVSDKDIYPNNSRFYEFNKNQRQERITISLTPKGYPITQEVLRYLSEFSTINMLCGRFEGFDERVNTLVDLELSLGDFVLNGGEVAAMAIVEGVSRLLPEFITKSTSVEHDSFGTHNNYYAEQSNYSKVLHNSDRLEVNNLFDNSQWMKKVKQLEHPVYTRPEIWHGIAVPEVLINGNHKRIQDWRSNWYRGQ
jgi:tRNA (guanine37-N1)-methyltransferase